MFSDDILSDIIVIKAVTEKTVRNLNLNFNFFSDGNSRGDGLSGTMLTLL